MLMSCPRLLGQESRVSVREVMPMTSKVFAILQTFFSDRVGSERESAFRDT